MEKRKLEGRGMKYYEKTQNIKESVTKYFFGKHSFFFEHSTKRKKKIILELKMKLN